MNNLPRRRLVEKTLRKVREKYGVHNRPFTKEDFYRICKREKIRLANHPNMESRRMAKKFRGILGFCAFSSEHNFYVIYLRCFFFKRFDIDTAMHELGHYFLGHTTSGAKFKTVESRDKKYEPEADYFMDLATGKKEVENGR